VLPQVLAGLGVLSILSAGCVLWLERLQPLFVTVAVSALSFQSWLIWRRPPALRTRTMLFILAASIGVSLLVLAMWVGLWLRYR
jgi:hypothetical protein